MAGASRAVIARACTPLAALCLFTCSAPDQGGTDAVEDAVIQEFVLPDISLADSTPSETQDAGNDPLVKPDAPVGNAARIRFQVDDSQNQTYSDGQLVWTGSFSWTAADNTIMPATSWLPEDGPYPALYDDGPVSQGGHEPEDSAKGDHLFETEILFQAVETTSFEYGVLNEFDRWIWIGLNGVFEVPAGSTATLTIPGLTIPAFGEVDLKISLDIHSLHPDFADITPFDPLTGLGYKIYLKGSFNSWTPVQLLDDGNKGDDTAGDGLFTYVQSQNLGPHDGTLYPGQHAQLVFVFAMDGFEPDEGLEYKAGNQAAADGVTAFSDHGSPGIFQEETLVMERDSRGKVFNTTVIIGDGKPWCNEDDDCFEPVECVDGGCGKPTGKPDPVIQVVTPSSGPTLGGTTVTVNGADFDGSAKVSLDGLEVPPDTVTSTTITFTTPKHAMGPVAVKVENPGGGFDTREEGFHFVPLATPQLDGVVGTDWDDTLLLAGNDVATDWADNELKGLYAAYDATHLYIGIVGSCGEDNAIVVYLDRDFGKATGHSDMTILTDDEGEIDAAISSKLDVNVDGFGADFAFGTKGMKSFFEGSDLWPTGDTAGWRGLDDPAEFAWLQGSVITAAVGGNGVEAAVPLTNLFGQASADTTVTLVVKLVNADGQYASNQTVPQAADSWSVSLVAGFPVR